MIYNIRSDIQFAAVYDSYLPYGGYKEQLYNRQAWIVKPNVSDFIILQSHSVVIAAYQHSTQILWVFGYYSKDMFSYVEEFQSWLVCNYSISKVPRTVKLYNDSRTGKRAARENLEDDFASVIESALNQH